MARKIVGYNDTIVLDQTRTKPNRTYVIPGGPIYEDEFHRMVDCPICQQLEKGDDMSWRHIFEKAGTCVHDWEEIDSTVYPGRDCGPYLPEGWEVVEVKWRTLTSDWRLEYKGERVYSSMIDATYLVNKKVCVKCGECVDELEEWTRKLVGKAQLRLSEEKRDRQRKILAKKMWNECEKRGEV